MSAPPRGRGSLGGLTLTCSFQAHLQVCPKFPLTCDGCGKKKISREKVSGAWRRADGRKGQARGAPVRAWLSGTVFGRVARGPISG